MEDVSTGSKSGGGVVKVRQNVEKGGGKKGKDWRSNVV